MHYQPPFPKNMDNSKNSSINKNWKQKFSPSKSSLRNSNLDNSSTFHIYKKIERGGTNLKQEEESSNVKQKEQGVIKSQA